MNTTLGPKVGEVRGRLNAGHRLRSFTPGLATFLLAALAWAGTLVGVMLAPGWVKIPCALFNGLFISTLFLAGHDAAHGILLPSRRLNRLVGRLALLPALHPLAAWVHNHNVLHHGFTNIKEKDPGFPPLSLAEYRALPAWRRWLHRRCRSWYGLGLYYALEMWLKWEVLPSRERSPRDPKGFRRDRLLALAFAAGLVTLLAGGAMLRGENPLLLVAVGFVLPFAVWNWLIGFIILQQHTHPQVPWYSELDTPPSYFQTQVRATPHLVFAAPMRFLMRNIMEHTAHHADPGVPLYRLAKAQKTLQRAYEEEIICVRWTIWSFFRLFRVCRLYDYQGHRWLDYDGTPTTSCVLPFPDREPERLGLDNAA